MRLDDNTPAKQEDDPQQERRRLALVHGMRVGEIRGVEQGELWKRRANQESRQRGWGVSGGMACSEGTSGCWNPQCKQALATARHIICWRMGFPCGLFPPVWCFPPRCLGAAPLRFLCRAMLLAFMSCVPDASGIPVPGRPPGHQHGFGTPAAAEQCSKQNVQGLPHPRAGSEYENNLHAAWANRMMELINLRLNSCDCDMSGANFERPAPAQQPPPLQSAELRPDSLTGLPRAQLGRLLCTQAEDIATVHVPELGAQAAAPPGSDEFTALAEQIANMKAEADAAQANSFRQLEQMRAMFHHVVSQLPAPAATPVPVAEPPAAPAATPTLHQQKIAHAAMALQDHYISKSTAADAPTGSTLNEPESRPHAFGAKNELDTTAAVKIFAVALQDLYISKSTAADAPTGSTLN